MSESAASITTQDTRPVTVAHVAPLVVFMLFLQLAQFLKVENSALPWYQSAPEHWVYPLQCVVVAAMLIWNRRHYVFAPWRGLGLALGLAIVGIAVWVLPSRFAVEPGTWWQEWLGLVKRTEGFDPSIFDAGAGGHTSGWWLTVLLRFVRMVVIVPIVEELFWRGFLMRYVQAKGKPWQRVPFGQHTWRAFWMVTLFVALIHNTPDRPAAFVWGALVYMLAVRTRSLGACLVMHAFGNLLLGIYVILTRQWGFW